MIPESPESLTLKDGRSVVLDLAGQGDAERVHEYIGSLGQSTDLVLSCQEDMLTLAGVERYMDQVQRGEFYSLLATDPESECVVASASFSISPRLKLSHCAELGIGVLESHRGQGLGALLLGRAIDDMRNRVGIDRLELTTLSRNAVAIALYERAGFVREGVKCRSFKQPDGRLEDEIIMGMWIGE